MAGDKAGGRDCLCPGISRSAQRAASFRSFPFVLRLSGVPVWGLCGIFTFFFIFFLIFQNAYNAHVPSLTGKWCLQVKPKREEKRGQPSGRGTQPGSRGPRLPQAVPQAGCPAGSLPSDLQGPALQGRSSFSLEVSQRAGQHQGRDPCGRRSQVPTPGPSKASGPACARSAPAHPAPPPRARRALPTGLPPTAPAQKRQAVGAP